MYTFIRNLQKKPDQQKRTIIIGLMVVCVIGVGGIWVALLERRISNPEASGLQGAFSLEATHGETPNDRTTQSTPISGPFGSLKKSLGTGLASIQEQISVFTDDLSRSQEEQTSNSELWLLPTNTQ